MDQDRLDVTGVQVGDDANNQQLECVMLHLKVWLAMLTRRGYL